MIGIDIVDLRDPLLRDRNKSLRFILNQDDEYPSVQPFWKLWTAKEALFKALRKPQKFIPKEIPVRFISDCIFGSGEIHGIIETSKNYIVSLAFSSTKPKIKIIEYPDVHLEHSANLQLWKSKGYEFSNKNGIPSVNGIPISISHHGNFLAYAYPKELELFD